MPIARFAFCVGDGNDNQPFRLATKHDAKRIAFQQTVSTAAVSGRKSFEIGKNRFKSIIDSQRKSNRCAGVTFRIPVKGRVEIVTRPGKVLNCFGHDRSALMLHLEFATTESSQPFPHQVSRLAD